MTAAHYKCGHYPGNDLGLHYTALPPIVASCPYSDQLLVTRKFWSPGANRPSQASGRGDARHYAFLVDIDQPESKRLIEERLWRLHGLVLAIAETRHEFSFELPVTRLEPLESEDRVQLWQDALGPKVAGLGDAIAAVAMQFKFGPRTIASAAQEGGDLWQAG